MASNCQYWKNKKCAGTTNDYAHYCSLDSPEYEECSLYKTIKVKLAGGTMEDMLKGGTLLGKEASVEGGLGRRLSDEELNKITASKVQKDPEKRWWEFWKRD